MASQLPPSWTFVGLISAFIDLFIAYFLLWWSAFAFFLSNFLDCFGFLLPCPCTGFFGYQNSDLCWHKLLFDEPVRRFASVQMLIKTRLPFDLIWFKQRPAGTELLCRNCCNEIGELENEASSSSFSASKLADKDVGFDSKGKKIVNQKQRSGIRRRKRSTLGFRRLQSPMAVSGGFNPRYGSDCFGSAIGNQDAGNSVDMNERLWQDFKENGENEMKDNYMNFRGNFVCDPFGVSGDDVSVVRMLEEALEVERAACSVLQSELEKERAAAATAADEAMAMILRLQEDKAMIEMETRQYHCMIEENFAYQEEEMNILKEILVRRERENHFLEKELEAHREMRCVQSEGDLSYMTSDWEQKPSCSFESNEVPPLVLQEIESNESVGKNKLENVSNDSSTYTDLSDLVPLEATQICSDNKNDQSLFRNKLKKGEEPGIEGGGNLQGSTLDSETIVYDVHVIDDKKTNSKKEEYSAESGRSDSSATDFEVLCREVSYDRNRGSREGTSEHRRRSINVPLDLPRSSAPSPRGERLVIDNEIEFLRQRLRRVQEGKGKLTFPTEQRDTVNAQLKLMEEILNHLREIQQLREPSRQASLPPKPSQLSLRKRRCRSETLILNESSS